MSSALDSHFEAFNTAMDAIKVARRILDRRENPVSNTCFQGMATEEGHAVLDHAQEQLNQLVSFALFAAFERILQDQIVDNLKSVGSSSTEPEELAGKLHDFLQDNVGNWKLDHVLGLFAPPVSQQDVSDAKGIRTYRHHVAHGASPPVAIPPATVYKQLSRFLTSAGLS